MSRRTVTQPVSHPELSGVSAWSRCRPGGDTLQVPGRRSELLRHLVHLLGVDRFSDTANEALAERDGTRPITWTLQVGDCYAA